MVGEGVYYKDAIRVRLKERRICIIGLRSKHIFTAESYFLYEKNWKWRNESFAVENDCKSL